MGEVAAPKRLRRTRRERLGAALSLLDDDRFDRLITGHSALQDLPQRMGPLLDESETILHVVDHPRYKHSNR
ncbi:hypothetical protein [Nesterenkonia pannonica]|uniref:hypothetical protein n=1 Tax=Nesterenkonia pannonica TaxID=1548602 RepID=UPI002164CE0D|nr:hypothetical protein [Nesterenkonia pannonica]